MSSHEIFTEPPTELEKHAEAIAAKVRENLCQFEAGIKDSFDAYFPLNGCPTERVYEAGEINDIANVQFLTIIEAMDVSDTEIVYGNNKRLFKAISSHKVTLEDGSIVEAPFMAHYSSEPAHPLQPDTELMEELEQKAIEIEDRNTVNNVSASVVDSLKNLVEEARYIGETAIKALFDKGYNAADIDFLLCSGCIENNPDTIEVD